MLSLDAALEWHLTGNHFPPIPTFFIPQCKAAIEAGQEEDWNLPIELPRGIKTPEGEIMITWKDSGEPVARAADLIESFHLESFLDSVEGE